MLEVKPLWVMFQLREQVTEVEWRKRLLEIGRLWNYCGLGQIIYVNSDVTEERSLLLGVWISHWVVRRTPTPSQPRSTQYENQNARSPQVSGGTFIEEGGLQGHNRVKRLAIEEQKIGRREQGNTLSDVIEKMTHLKDNLEESAKPCTSNKKMKNRVIKGLVINTETIKIQN